MMPSGSERDRLQSHAAALEEKLALQSEAADKRQAEATAAAAALARQSDELKIEQEARAQLTERLAAADAEILRLNGELATRDRALADARAPAGSGDAKRVSELLEAAERRRVEQDELRVTLLAEHAAQIEGLSAELTSRMAQTRAEQEAQIHELQSRRRSGSRRWPC